MFEVDNKYPLFYYEKTINHFYSDPFSERICTG
ncbi:hypothetical protein CHRYSEOSP005_25120 [Chryseobacterium sp. Alg-005]